MKLKFPRGGSMQARDFFCEAEEILEAKEW